MILAGALTVATVMEVCGVDAIEVTEAGLREGVFFETLLDGDPPLFEDVRRASVLNLAHQYHWDAVHTEHVGTLALADVRHARDGRPARGRPRGARAALGRGDAPRRRRRGGLRRPPQALALPDPQRRAARVHPARGGADRADGPVSPQGRPEHPRRGPAARRATATSRCSTAAPRCCAWPSTSTAGATSRSTPRAWPPRTGWCAWTCSPTAIRRSPAGRPSASASSSSTRSGGAGRRGLRSPGRRRGAGRASGGVWTAPGRDVRTIKFAGAPTR